MVRYLNDLLDNFFPFFPSEGQSEGKEEGDAGGDVTAPKEAETEKSKRGGGDKGTDKERIQKTPSVKSEDVKDDNGKNSNNG